MIVYGIKNCDTVKKARKWLDSQAIDYHFHDMRESGIDQQTLQQWCHILGWEKVLNRRSTTWRQLPEDIKKSIDEPSAIAHMLTHPTLIKRPVLVTEKHVLCGFQVSAWQQAITVATR